MAQNIGSSANDGGYSAPLDGLRFFAFLLVFLHHGFGAHYLEPVPLVRFGYYGVHVFFVLSGFLIGRILLDLRDRDDLSLTAKLGRFYARRALRIFPVYYAVILLLALVKGLGLAPNRPMVLGWDAAYLTNVALYLERPMMEIHLWSLSVEEHFYLVAPLALLLVGRRALPWLVLGLWLVVAAARVGVELAGLRPVWMLSPMLFDTLSVGIAAALVERDGHFLGVTRRRFVQVGGVAAAAVVAIVVRDYVTHRAPSLAVSASMQWLLAAASAALTLALWRSRPESWLARFFGCKPFVYLGKISYGLYLFHLFVLNVAVRSFSGQSLRAGAVALALTILLAAASWHFFERPLNELKRHFSYGSKARAPDAEPRRKLTFFWSYHKKI